MRFFKLIFIFLLLYPNHLEIWNLDCAEVSIAIAQPQELLHRSKSKFLGSLGVCSFSLQMPEMADLSQIPEQDRDRIEKLFFYLLINEGFAYVLFGSKPMSIIGHDKTTPASYKDLYPHPMFELESWWKTWEKYCHLFPMKDYLLFAQDDEEWFQVLFINKISSLKIIEENHSFFKEKIGQNLAVTEMFEHIFDSTDFFNCGLNKSHALFGLLLGYGKENSKGFERYSLRTKRSDVVSPRGSNEIVPTEENEFMVPCFASFSDRETWRMMKKYHRERDMIINIYSKGNFLEITLNKLMA